ncbi:transposable element Tc1 transposase [Trichonephila clavipes]|nr:transposable element Tc1 transposase [Trichonephila clavipes]
MRTFSDEIRFSLSPDCRRQLIWREGGTAYRPENIQEKDRYPTCIIMVWAGIMINGRTRLHVVANGTMTDQRYIDEVLLPHVRLFRGAVGDKFVFMDDNATYLNPIENVWDALGRQVAGRNYPPTNKNTLIRALTEEWDKLPQQLLDNVVQIHLFSEYTQKTDYTLLLEVNAPGVSKITDELKNQFKGKRESDRNAALFAEFCFGNQRIYFQQASKLVTRCVCRHRTAMGGSDVVQSRRPIFGDFFQHLWPYIGNNTANVVFQMVKRLWLIRIDQ